MNNKDSRKKNLPTTIKKGFGVPPVHDKPNTSSGSKEKSNSNEKK